MIKDAQESTSNTKKNIKMIKASAKVALKKRFQISKVSQKILMEIKCSIAMVLVREVFNSKMLYIVQLVTVKNVGKT